MEAFFSDGVWDLMSLEAGMWVLEKLNGAGFLAYFVGGMVRDRLLGCPMHDVDIATSALPVEVEQLFPKTIPTGIGHGTVTVLFEKIPIEVTTFRRDGKYSDYRRPDNVSFTSSLEEDLRRRDFTINAIAMDALGAIYDPMQGAVDLRHSLIRAVGNAHQRFAEDPLRMLRALRFVSKLGFHLDSGVREGLIAQGHLITGIARERVMQELEGIIGGSFRIRAMELFQETGLLAQFGDLSPLMRFEPSCFEELTMGFDLLLAASLFNKTETFQQGWPLTALQKKMLKRVGTLCSNPEEPAWIIYQDGEAIYKSFQRLQAFLGNCYPDAVGVALPIRSRKELVLSSQEIMEAAKIQAGPLAGDVIKAVEQAIVLGKLENNPRSIREFIGVGKCITKKR